MAANPQPPQQPQPIYPNDFNLAVDRLYARLAGYVDSRLDPIVVQMRVDRQDAQARDEALLRRLDALTGIVQNLVTAVQDLQVGQRALQQQITDSFAMVIERMNDLAVRVERVERGEQNPPPQA